MFNIANIKSAIAISEMRFGLFCSEKTKIRLSENWFKGRLRRGKTQ